MILNFDFYGSIEDASSKGRDYTNTLIGRIQVRILLLSRIFLNSLIMKKKIFILRSAPGAGKSTLAEILDDRPNWHTVCADDYLYNEDGVYDFSLAKGGANHMKCQARFTELLKDELVEGIIVSNTNTKPSDYKFYEDKAAEVGAMVFHLVVENRHGGKNTHNVPEETIERMKNNLRSNIIL